MTRGLRTFVMGSVLLLASACATSVGGTAEVNSGAVVPSSIAPASSGGVSVPSSFPDPTDLSVPSSDVPESTDPLPTETSEPPLTEPSTTESTETTESSTEPSTTEPSTTKSTPTTTKTTPTTSKQVSLPTKLHCKSGALTSAGGVFCYEIPDGFTNTSSTATYPGTDKVKTAIQPSDSSGSARDLIFVTSTTLKVNSDELSDALIKTSLNQALKSGTSSSTFSTLIQTKVAGDRAFETTIKFTDGVMQRYLLVFSGKTRVSVSCQWQDAKAAITAACKTVLSTMQIKNP